MLPLLLPLRKTLLMLRLVLLMPLPLPLLMLLIMVEVVEVVMLPGLPELPETKQVLRIKVGQVIPEVMLALMGLVIRINMGVGL
jgi:hypothetical protein